MHETFNISILLLIAAIRRQRSIAIRWPELIQIINDFENKGVDCVALACTDLQLLIPKHPALKVFDTMKILSDATVKNILGK